MATQTENRIEGLAGVVLCGGRSRRMGRDKATLPMGDELLIQRMVRILRRVAHPVAVVAAPGQSLPSLPDDVIVVTDSAEGLGPLQGIADGLRAVAPHADRAFLSSCDAPLLQTAFVRLLDGLLQAHDVVVPVANGYHHVLAGVYRTDVRDAAETLLAADRRRPFFLLERVRTLEVDEATLRSVDPELDSLRNVNTPEDYEAVLQRLPIEEEDG